MKLSHEQIQELLPEYLQASQDPIILTEIQAHMMQCQECRDTFRLLSELRCIEVPDPGDLFWNTLSQGMRARAREERTKRPGTIFTRKLLVPAAAAMMLLMLVFFIAYRGGKNTLYYDPLFRDPLEYSLLEYGSEYGYLSEKDIRPSPGKFPTSMEYRLDPTGYSYQGEFVSLNSEELASLDKALTNKKNKGG